ncbi:DUF998 domain-containing protein [Proteiniclasticum sp. C24MP]|uniref:DUF998 domain-containing protein n=1 Tax=Proteiniclasticum sp. C24MP TaxID=3374101 RepID=UPI0037547710
MRNEKEDRFRQIISLTGAAGVLFYTAHVILGGLLWEGYSHITQTISELTAKGSPNAEIPRVLSTIYAVLLIVFSFYLFSFMRRRSLHKAAVMGSFFFILMQITSFIGYSLFPLDLSESISDFTNVMHLVVTFIVVLCTLLSSFSLGYGLRKEKKHRKIGKFILLCAVIITLSGALTPLSMAKGIEVSGLLERINIFTLLSWVFVLSVYLFREERRSMK